MSKWQLPIIHLPTIIYPLMLLFYNFISFVTVISHLFTVGSISSFSSSGNKDGLKAVARGFCLLSFTESAATGDYNKNKSVTIQWQCSDAYYM